MPCLLGCCCVEDVEPSGEAPRHMSQSPMKKSVCCTDVIFLLIFTAFSAFIVYIGVFAFVEGAAFRLIYGYDSFGNTCDYENKNITGVALSGQDTTGMSHVFYLDVTKPFGSGQLCISQCPTENIETKEELKAFALETKSKLCYYNIDPNTYDTLTEGNFSDKGPCPKLPLLKSMSVMNRCVPNVDRKNETEAIIDQINQNDWVTKISQDMLTTWKEMLVLCFVALVIALIFVLIMRFVAGIIVWLTIAVSAIGTLVASGALWWTWWSTKSYNEDNPLTVLRSDEANETLFLVLAIVCSIITVILLLIILVMRSRIALVVALFKEAGKCIGAMPTVLVQPLWTFTILIIWLVYSLSVLTFLSASGNEILDDKGFSGGMLGVAYEKIPAANIFWWFQLVGLVWIAEFILACQQMVIAGAVAFWFFTRDKSGLTCCLVGKATCRVILHHLGSVAFGSFIITLVKLPRLILMYIQKKTRSAENFALKFIAKCCICCLWCLEKMLKFLNQNAYTIVVIEGKSFCPAAKKALSIIVSNALRVTAINSVGDFVLFLVKVAVTASTTAIAVFWLQDNEDLHFWAIPVVFVGIFAFLIGHCFVSVYEMVIDTLLLCFCEDEDKNDGTEGHEYFMSKTLMKFVEDSDRALENLKRRKRKMDPI